MYPTGLRPCEGIGLTSPDNDSHLRLEYDSSRSHLQGWAPGSLFKKRGEPRWERRQSPGAADPRRRFEGPVTCVAWLGRFEKEAGEMRSSRRETSPPGWPHESRQAPPAPYPRHGRWFLAYNGLLLI